MDSDSYLIGVFFLSVLLSAFVFSVRIAYSSLRRTDLIQLRKDKARRSQRVLQLLTFPSPFLLTLKIASLVLDVVLVISGMLLTNFVSQRLGLTFPITLVLIAAGIIFILFLIRELWANIYVRSNARVYAEIVSLPVWILYRLLAPFVKKLHQLLTLYAKKTGLAGSNHLLGPVDIQTMVENGEEMGDLEDNERAMIHSIFQFGETEVREIMVPRIDMVCIDEKASLQALTRLIKTRGHSRIPLYSEDVDTILGVIHAKDLLPYIVNKKAEVPELRKLARPAYFVPETKKLQLLLKEFQKDKYHMAIVVDEYGGTAGLVTLEDVLEEIVGDIQDEYDREPPLYRKIEPNKYSIAAKIDLHDLNEKLRLDLPTEGDYESLGGFILSQTGYVPEENEVVNYKNYRFVIEKVERNRIMRVQLSREEVVEDEKMDSGKSAHP